jgi:hypothetical protein
MTTSLAMGYLTGDQLPDIFEVNYIQDSQISKRPRRNPQGQVVETLMPKEFQPGLDRLIIGTAQGDPTFYQWGNQRPPLVLGWALSWEILTTNQGTRFSWAMTSTQINSGNGTQNRVTGPMSRC